MQEHEIFDYQILRLTDAFYKRYPSKEYPELLEKKGRGYNCLLIQTHKSGLDYTKIVIVKKHEYISAESAMIDKDEYIKTVRNISRIAKESEAYIEEYVAYMKNECVISEMDFRRKYGMSTLKYFHEELNLN